MIRLRLVPTSLEHIPSFVALTGFAVEDVPLRGAAGRMDWLLGGEASRMILEGRLDGSWESQALLSARGRMAPCFVLIAGLGRRRGLRGAVLTSRIEGLVRRVLRISVRDMASGVFSPEPSGRHFDIYAAETLAGAMRALEGCRQDVDLALCEPDAGRYNELVAVAERMVFQRRGEMEISLEVTL